MSESATTGLPEGRLVSLDVFRGLTMFVLIAESALVYEALMSVATPGSFLEGIVLQFNHHPWHGLRFWDLVQPFFMFIVGVAMAFSVNRRRHAGDTWGHTFRHIAVRCVILLGLGVSLHIGYSRAMVWELWNVLSQLSVTIMVAYLLFNLPFRTQLAISFGLILLSEILYRTGIRFRSALRPGPELRCLDGHCSHGQDQPEWLGGDQRPANLGAHHLGGAGGKALDERPCRVGKAEVPRDRGG